MVKDTNICLTTGQTTEHATMRQLGHEESDDVDEDVGEGEDSDGGEVGGDGMIDDGRVDG
jgi:hypothetical protein